MSYLMGLIKSVIENETSALTLKDKSVITDISRVNILLSLLSYPASVAMKELFAQQEKEGTLLSQLSSSISVVFVAEVGTDGEEHTSVMYFLFSARCLRDFVDGRDGVSFLYENMVGTASSFNLYISVVLPVSNSFSRLRSTHSLAK